MIIDLKTPVKCDVESFFAPAPSCISGKFAPFAGQKARRSPRPHGEKGRPASPEVCPFYAKPPKKRRRNDLRNDLLRGIGETRGDATTRA